MRIVAQRELRNEYRRLLEEVEAGAEITITDRGRPIARLVPIVERRRFASAVAIERALAGDPIDGERFRRDTRPLDADRIADE
jgi:prevent-host-death family protein